MQYKTIPLTKSEMEKFPATAMAFNPDNNYLVIGDEFGSITFWDLTVFLKKVLETREDRSRIKEPSSSLLMPPLNYAHNKKKSITSPSAVTQHLPISAQSL